MWGKNREALKAARREVLRVTNRARHPRPGHRGREVASRRGRAWQAAKLPCPRSMAAFSARATS
ncbi:hypothetical protein ACU4GD_14070 [Cupriavidus basilensis]